MIRLEFKEGSSSKFWELALDGSAYKVRWGRIGTNGQEKNFTFPSSLKAKAEADKLVAEKKKKKKKKGYQEIALKGAAAKAAKSAKAGAAAKETAPKRNPQLEKLIAKDPEDPTNYLVYGDWLTAQGDPRGELVTVQHAISELAPADKKTPKGKALLAREKSILNANANFTGISSKLVSLGWRWGFIQSVRFNNSDDWMDDEEKLDIPKLVNDVFAAPAIVGLTSIEVCILRWDWVGKDLISILKAVAASPVAKQITKFKVAPPDGDVDTGMFDPGKGVEMIAATFPNLEALTVHGNDFSLGTMKFPKLRELHIETCGLPKKNLASIANGSFPKVERANIWFGSNDYGGNCKVKDIQPILDGKVFPKIEHLGLMNAEFTDDIATAIVRSKILPRLKTLNLSLGTMGAKGTKAFLDNVKAIAHLDSIDVHDNHLSKKELGELRKLGKPVFVSREQKELDLSIPGEEYRYVSVAE